MTEARRLDEEHPITVIEDPASVGGSVLPFFLAYWRIKRDGRPLPLRSAFDPREVRGNLPWVTMADRAPGPGGFRYRVIGSRITAYFLRDATGKMLREAFAGADETFVAGVERLYNRACELRAPIWLGGAASHYERIFYPAHEALYLPYSSDGETADRIVNVFWYELRHLRSRDGAPSPFVEGV